MNIIIKRTKSYLKNKKKLKTKNQSIDLNLGNLILEIK